MTLIDRYIFRSGLGAFLGALVSLTGVIWITQSLQQFDLLTTKGQSLIIFFTLTGLTLPSLIVLIAPIALFFAVLTTLNRLNGDNELVVMTAAGLSPLRLLRPFLLLTVLISLLIGVMSLWAMPASFLKIRDMITQVRADFLTRIVREGQFVTLDQGFVFHYRERGPDGSLRGIFIQDRRDPQHINTYIAEVGVNVQKDNQNYLILQKGSVQRQTPGEVDPAMVSFESYAIDLTQFGSEAEGAPLKPREYATLDLFSLDRSSDYVKANLGRLMGELHDRFINPLYALVFGLIGFAALGQPQTTRQARGLRLGLVIAGVIVLRIAGFGASALVAKSLQAIWLVYGLPVIAMTLAVWFIFWGKSR